MSVSLEFSIALIFILTAVVFVGGNLILNRLFRPRNPYPEKNSTYECGEHSVGSPWIRFNIRYYIIAILFLIFDVEVLFIIPWAVQFKKLYESLGILAFFEMFVFLLILGLGLAYCWVKGHLEWVLKDRKAAGSNPGI
ncbi:MAG: NADH-quinone oxidoreductase subunit A [Candidatus Omnitrophica bacterium]|nr:NADH-quinone oxidoreductase subunit A [Candidatus Omnitrophota bacterium]